MSSYREVPDFSDPGEEEAYFDEPLYPDYDYNSVSQSLPVPSPEIYDHFLNSDCELCSSQDYLCSDDPSPNFSKTEQARSTVEIASDDSSIAYSNSVIASRSFLRDHFGPNLNTFHASGVFGLIVMRLEDFSLIRSDNRSNREFPHFLIFPNEDFPDNHPDFLKCLQLFYP